MKLVSLRRRTVICLCPIFQMPQSSAPYVITIIKVNEDIRTAVMPEFWFYINITTNVGPFPTYFIIDHFISINYCKYRLILLPPHNSPRISHVCCYFCRKIRGWNGFQKHTVNTTGSNPKRYTRACSESVLNSVQSSEPRQQSNYSDWDTGWTIDDLFFFFF